MSRHVNARYEIERRRRQELFEQRVRETTRTYLERYERVAGLKFQDEVRALQAIVGSVDRSSGGRGVLNALTTSLFDPLAQFLFSEVGAPDRSQGRNIMVVQAGSKAVFDFELE